MSLLTSLLNLTVVVAAGWFTIYYIIPKIESGELGLPSGTGSGTKKDEEQQIPEDIAGAATAGDEPEPPPPEDEEPAPKEEKSTTKKQKKGKGEWLSGDKTGKDNRKKKAKEEFRIIEYLVEMGY